MTDPAFDFDVAHTQVEHAIWEVIEAFTKPLQKQRPPKLIYHYTNDVGLRSILETGALWLTDINSLNDPSELQHGVNVASDLILKSASGRSREIQFFIENFRSVLARTASQVANYFVCCFSKNGDELGQWRAYADNGRGYALAFDADQLEKRFCHGSKARQTFPLGYSDDDLRVVQQGLIDVVIAQLAIPIGKKNVTADSMAQYYKKLSVELASGVVFGSLFFKHKGYKNEDEYRFLETHSLGAPVPGLSHRSRPHSLVRYTKFDWRKTAEDSLKQIVIGPAADKKISHHFVADCLRAFHNGPVVSITQSEIPYRAM